MACLGRTHAHARARAGTHLCTHAHDDTIDCSLKLCECLSLFMLYSFALEKGRAQLPQQTIKHKGVGYFERNSLQHECPENQTKNKTKNKQKN